MHKTFIGIVLFYLWCSTHTFAQRGKVFSVLDLSKPASILTDGVRHPSFIFAKYLRYPSATLQARRGGFGLVSFVVEPDGKLSNFRVMKAPDSLCASMLQSVVFEHTSTWIPAEANGNMVRQSVSFVFYFHPIAAQVYFIGDSSPVFYNWEAFEALTPSEYYKYNCATSSKALSVPKFQPLYVPPAAKAAKLNAEVRVAYEIDQDGVLSNARALNDPGYGCAEAAVAFVSQRKYWIPQCHYDTCFSQEKIEKIMFCTDSTAITHSTFVAEESTLIDYPIENTYELYRSYTPFPRTGFVRVDMIVEKDGKPTAISYELDGKDTLLLADARKWMSKLVMPVPLSCGLPCRLHLVRYLYFHSGIGRSQWGKMLYHSPATHTPPDFEYLYKPEETDQPVTNKFGIYGLQQLHRGIWQYPENALKQGIKGFVVVRVVITESANTYPKVISGIGGGCDEMAIQIILGTDFNWHPAKVNGYRVKSYIDVSIPFFF